MSATSTLVGLMTWVELACAAPPRVPMMWRPDTREITGIVIDSATIRAAVELFRADFPKERAVCFYGELRDTTIAGANRRLVIVNAVKAATQDSASEFHVWFHAGARAGCSGPRLIGIAHDHPHAVGAVPCTHSDADSNLLFGDLRVLFTMIFCGDGRAEVFFQDGRREADMWYRKAAPP